MARENKLEPQFYPIVQKMLEEKGFPTNFILVRKFALIPPSFIPDLFAFRWGGKDVETIAVECKRGETAEGSAINALKQALLYQKFCSSVYVATPPGDLGELEDYIREFGFGHISVDVNNRSGEITIQPRPNNRELFERKLRPRLIPFLIFGEMWGGEIREANEWGHIRIPPVPEEPHLSSWYNDVENLIYLQINLARSWIIRRFYEIDKRRFCELLSKTGSEVRFDVWEREKVRGRPRPKDEMKYKDGVPGYPKPAREVSERKLESVLGKCKQMEGKFGGDLAFIKIYTTFAHESKMTKEEFTEEMKNAWEPLRPIWDFVKHAFSA